MLAVLKQNKYRNDNQEVEHSYVFSYCLQEHLYIRTDRSLQLLFIYLFFFTFPQ